MPQIKIGDIQIPHTLPIGVEQIGECRWDGVWAQPVTHRHESRQRAVMASIFESADYPGYFHCRVVGSDVSETRKPVSPELVGVMMEHLLNAHGRACSELRWVRAGQGMADNGHAWQPSAPKGEIVYFLRAGDFVKIGKATGAATSRVSQLKTGCPFPIEVVATIPGGYAKEGAIHRRFASIRAHGEWFHATPELLAYVAEVSA